MRKALIDEIHKHVRTFVTILFVISLVACTQNNDEAVGETFVATTSGIQIDNLDVYKNRSCECCKHWQTHVKQNGFSTVSHYPADLNALKTEQGIAPQFQSCHTAISKQGYVFEGHIPVRLIVQFLNNPPENALGLAVPGMPIGSPGMEMGDRFSPYEVLLLLKDGSSERFAKINSAEEQW